MKRNDLCILVSSFDRYLPIARWTISQIERHWRPHPPIYLAGCTTDDSLPLTDDPGNWMRVSRSACHCLLGKGFRWVYLILDDHPPVGPCQATHLNETLPSLARELNALTICLESWLPESPLRGEGLNSRYHHLGRNAATFQWKFSLHPALWSLPSLIELLDHRINFFPLAKQTPWAFERHRGPEDGNVPERFLDATYRVHPTAMSIRNPRFLAIRTLVRTIRAYRGLLLAHLGKAGTNRYGNIAVALLKYIHGPYPMYKSGVMRGGTVNEEFLAFLRQSANQALLRSWRSVAASIPPQEA